MKKFLILFLFAAGLCRIQAQFPTLSYETPVFNRVTAPAISPVPSTGAPGATCSAANTTCAIQNAGMGSHLITLCIVGGTVSTIDYWLEGSNDTTVSGGVPQPANWQQISPDNTVTTGTVGCGTLEAAGYFTWLRLHLGTLTGAGATITAWYAGIGTALPSAQVIQNRGSQNVSFIPSILAVFNAVKSTAVTVSAQTIAVYAAQLSNPNTVPVFVTLTCPGQGTAPIWEIPANDMRAFDVGGPTGLQCNANSTVACSTSATAAVDPTNACLITFEVKNYLSVRNQINFAGTTGATTLQRPD